MPTYQYRNTDKPDETVELTMSIAAKEQLGDEFRYSNDGPVWKRVFTPAAVHFKGSGFYSTASRA